MILQSSPSKTKTRPIPFLLCSGPSHSSRPSTAAHARDRSSLSLQPHRKPNRAKPCRWSGRKLTVFSKSANPKKPVLGLLSFSRRIGGPPLKTLFSIARRNACRRSALSLLTVLPSYFPASRDSMYRSTMRAVTLLSYDEPAVCWTKPLAPCAGVPQTSWTPLGSCRSKLVLSSNLLE